MIIQQIANGLKKRDWGTVVLEVAIVVVGIFIGLQADDWNEQRLDNQREQIVLASLAADFEVNLQEIEFSIRHATQKHEAAQSLLSGSTDGSLVGQELDALIGGLTFWYVAPMSSGALESLLQGGSAALIRNQGLRNLLADWPAKFEFLRETQRMDYDTLRGEVMPLLFERGSVAQINNALKFYKASNSFVEFVPYEMVPLIPAATADHRIILEDRDFLNVLVQITWDMQDVKNVAEQLRGDIKTTLSMINAELNQNPPGEGGGP